jgi:hypothetical protein
MGMAAPTRASGRAAPAPRCPTAGRERGPAWVGRIGRAPRRVQYADPADPRPIRARARRSGSRRTTYLRSARTHDRIVGEHAHVARFARRRAAAAGAGAGAAPSDAAPRAPSSSVLPRHVVRSSGRPASTDDIRAYDQTRKIDARGARGAAHLG